MEYYIFITNDCNLNCKYCSVLLRTTEHTIPNHPVYSIDELSHFIYNTQISNRDECADIVFFGGEPTLDYPYIREIIQSGKEQLTPSFKVRYMLHTNGLLLGDIPEDILLQIETVMLSINYNMVPHCNLDDGYFKTLTDSIRTIKRKKSIPVIGRLTITEDTSLYSEIALFHNFFDAVYWQLENCDYFSDYNKYYNTYKYELELSFNLWLAYLKKGILLKFIPFIASACFALNKEIPDSFCCGYNSSIVFIQTNGNCYTCAENMTTSNNLIGNLQDGIQFENFGLEDTKCASCEYIHMCKGRCGRMHKEFSENHIKEYCDLNKYLFDLILRELPVIKSSIDLFGLSLEMNDPIYHYTEYTP